MSTSSLVLNTLKNILQILFNNKSLSDIEREELLADESVMEKYLEAIEILRKGEETRAKVKTESVEFEVYAKSM